MEVRLTLVTDGREVDVVVAGPPGTTLGELPGVSGATFWAGDVRLGPGHVVGVAPLLDGARVWLDGPGPPHEPIGPRQLRVVGGPDAGGIFTLRGGQTVIGRGAAGRRGIALADADVSRVQAVIDVRPDGVWVRDAVSTNGTSLDGEDVGADPVLMRPGAMLRCGESLLLHTAPTDPPAAVRPDGEGGVGLHRPPRLRPRRPPVEIVFPEPPPDRQRLRFPWILVLAPLLIGGLMWLVTDGTSSYLLIMLLSPLMFGANAISDRLTGRREHRRATAAHVAAIERTERDRDVALAEETAQRRSDCPDPASLLLTVLGPGARLWERRRSDDDALVLRLGMADLPARLTVRVPPSSEDIRLTVRAVPVAVPLRQVGVLGIAGHARRWLTWWLVAQLAALHPPRDLRLCLLTEDDSDAWSWFRWLPHTGTLVAVGTAQIAARVRELSALLDGRSDSEPDIVLVCDGADRLRAMPGFARLLGDGPATGIYSLCLATRATQLPEECGATAVLTGRSSADLRVTVRGEEPRDNVVADLVRGTWIDRLARGLAPIRDITPRAGGSLPTQVHLRDLVPGLGGAAVGRCCDPAAAAIAGGWRAVPRSTSAVLGVGADGTVSADLRADGPHVLVAGTTGSGKSELLQTLITGLALANRPDELTFVLVDYKGGAAFADCARLPHTVGMVTDLDPRLTSRALDSLAAELRRRERKLAAAGAKDIDAYQASAAGSGALARLVIVIDEFASLVAELPDFVAGLVDVARRGRSLGIHLVLATQRPAGVVSAEIRANTALRICLRVADAAESLDVIDSPAAARISQRLPGRAHVRLADGGITAVQAARVGGPARRDEPLSVAPVPWRDVGAQAPKAATDSGVTDLAELVDSITDAAGLIGVSAPRSPWLPPLPGLVTTADLPDPTSSRQQDVDGPPGAGFRIPLGLHDLPAEQRRDVYALDLAAGRHLLLAGSARTGRTSALRTIGAGIGTHVMPDVHLYALDSGGGLASLAALPHCGAVVPRDDTARGERLLHRLDAELARRRDVLAQSGFGSIAEQRAAVPPGERLPWLVLVVDSWEGFVHAHEGIDHGRAVDDLVRLLRDGPAAGLTAVVTGDRALLTARIATLIPDRLILRFPDPDSYGIAGIPPREVPAHLPPGRALVAGTESMTEVQLALLDSDPAGPAQIAALDQIVANARGVEAKTLLGGASGQRPFRLRPLPARVTLAGLASPPGSLLLGIGGDEAEPVALDLTRDGPGVLVAGPPGSGRSTALHTAAIRHVLDGGTVAVVASRRSPVSVLTGAPGVLGTFGSDDGDRLLSALAMSAGPVLVVADDADDLLDSGAERALSRILASGRHPVLVAGTTATLLTLYRGCTVDVRKSRCGVLLCPSGPHDGELFGVRVSRGQEFRPGRGVFVRRGASIPIQVAIADG